MWSSISYKLTIDPVGISERMDVDYYTNDFKRDLFRATDYLFGDDWTPHQGNAPLPTA